MLYQTYGDDGFAPLSVIVQDIAGETPTSDDAALWAEEMALSFPVLADSTGAFFPVWDPDGVLPITVIIGNDARWNAEVQLQTNTYGADRTVACELLPTRYDHVATALGAHGERVEDPEALTPAIERALASGKPSCIDVAIQPAPTPSLLGSGSGHG